MFAADMCKSKSTCTRHGAWKGKKSPCLCLVLVECTWILRRRVLAQYGQYLWPSVYFVLAEFALANGPASLQASGGVIGLMASRVSRQERPAPFADTGRHSRVPSRFSFHSPSSLCPVSVQPHRLRYASPFHPRTTDPPTHPRWWEKGTRQEPSWLPSPSNLSSAWRPQRVDGINIARQATSWTSSFIPLFSSRRRYPSPP